MYYQHKKNLLICTGLAIMLHLCLALLWLTSWHSSMLIAGNTQTHVLHAHLFRWKQLQQSIDNSHNQNPQNSTATHQKVSTKQHDQLIKDRAYKGLHAHTNKTRHSTKKSIGDGHPQEQGDAILLALIHNQVQQHHTYPPFAIAHRQTGTVWLSFQLQPTGHIYHLHILQSSGHKLLDDAAKQALIATSPFTLAPQHIMQPTWFTIHLVYGKPTVITH